MIRRIYIDNYKCLINFALQVDALTLILGANGAGKSAILDVLVVLRQLLDGKSKIADRDAFPGSTCTRWQEVNTQVVEVEVSLASDTFVYRLEIEHDADRRRARIQRETLHADGKPLFTFVQGEARLYRDNHGEGPTFPADWSESALARVAPRADNKRLTAFLEFMRRIVVCGLYPRTFTAESSGEAPVLERDGANFASWYRHMMLEHQELVPEFVAAVREVIDDFANIRLERVGTEARALMIVFRRGQGTGRDKYELRLDELSDGQRALLAIYALIHLTANQGYALFLDEPDNYVALAELQPWLMALADACGGTVSQVVLCSHHPELIDYLGPDHGVVLSREVTGVAKVSRAADIDLGDALKLSEVIARGWDR